MSAKRQGIEIIVRGIVQGVGFRPFVWRLAQRLGLAGEVRNLGDVVLIRAAGPPAALDALTHALGAEAPALARVERIERRPAELPEGDEFRIVGSASGAVSVGVVPDIAACPACRAEIADPAARRFGYAFTNCTDCGPRFSIVAGLPYDRIRTTMSGFALCPACRAEYQDPADRRFHAQPIACPACGPHLAWEPAARLAHEATLCASDAACISTAADWLRAGRILAVKGIGGFHIACDATNPEAVRELRRRKLRPAKPLAVMAADVAEACELCHVGPEEEAALAHPAAPIVLLKRRRGARLAPEAAPGQGPVGLMLPYTPLHHLLLAKVGSPLVMTSGNRSSEPQIFRDAEAREKLSGIVDGFLSHDRPIARRLDDSVVRLIDGRMRVLRRGRGLAPLPRDLPADFADAPPVLALGGELKSAACLTHGRKALLTHHLGDLDEPATGDAFETALADYAALFGHNPAAVAVDMHPGLRATRYGSGLAEARNLPLIAVQHHHAHIAAVLAENGWRRDQGKVVGIALDGLGFGADGALWGAEILLCDYETSVRRGRLRPIPLAGGDAASREPWRVLLAHLDAALGPQSVPPDLFVGKPAATLRAMIAKGLNAPLASSAGRLFDAMAALLGLAPDRLSFEGEAAMALEACAGEAAGQGEPYALAATSSEGLLELDPAPLWRAALADRAAGAPAAIIATRFHDGVAAAFANAAGAIARAGNIGVVALSGGVFQNARLLEATSRRLREIGLEALTGADAPANDGGLALGQAAVAAARLLRRAEPVTRFPPAPKSEEALSASPLGDSA
ncbi:MAG: carbamoyltransferase HypF [Methylocella sp.]